MPDPDLNALLAVTAVLNKTHQDHAADPEFASEAAKVMNSELPDPAPTLPPTTPMRKPGVKAARKPQEAPKAEPKGIAPSRTENAQRLLFTGSMCVGKDHIAKLTGATVHGFADPIYALVPLFFGVPCDKSTPGVREFLQRVGQWGRGEISEKYPLTVERAAFGTLIRRGWQELYEGEVSPVSSSEESLLASVSWERFGLTKDLWVDALLNRIGGKQDRIAVTNARFPNEVKRLRDDGGWMHWHVMCSPKTWAERLKKQNLTPQSPAVSDLSEQMAHSMNRRVLEACKQPGPMLRVIWNDTVPVPGPRLWTVNPFLQHLEILAA